MSRTRYVPKPQKWLFQSTLGTVVWGRNEKIYIWVEHRLQRLGGFNVIPITSELQSTPIVIILRSGLNGGSHWMRKIALGFWNTLIYCVSVNICSCVEFHMGLELVWVLWNNRPPCYYHIWRSRKQYIQFNLESKNGNEYFFPGVWIHTVVAPHQPTWAENLLQVLPLFKVWWWCLLRDGLSLRNMTETCLILSLVIFFKDFLLILVCNNYPMYDKVNQITLIWYLFFNFKYASFFTELKE